MASNGEFNWLGQQRADAPHLKMVESGVRGDLDALAYILVGEQPMVVKGFELLSSPIGLEASLITFKVASSKILHPLASESGSIYAVPSSRANEVIDPNMNSRVQGSIQPGTVNYIGIDLKRSSDATTADSVMFLDPSQNKEAAQKVPLRRTLDHVWIVSQTSFSFNRSVCPVAIVTTNNLNVVTAFQDARPLLGRLNPGGSNSSDVSLFSWPGGRPNVESSTTSPIAGDKSLTSLKTWMSAVMSRLHELGGGQYWYSLAADRNVHLHTGSTVFTSTGESFEVVLGTPNHLHWQGLKVAFDNSPQFSITVADQLTSVVGLTDLASGECIYVDIDRTSSSAIYAQKGQLSTLGGSSRPGQRWVIASRIGDQYFVSGQPWPIGSSFSLATTAHAGVIKTNIDMASPNPVAATIVTSGAASGVVTGKGLSNNLDMGTIRTYDFSSNLLIGRGTAAGDDNVVIKTDSQTKGTIIQGNGGINYPYLSVSRGSITGGQYGTGGTGLPANSTPLAMNGSRFEGTRSWAIEAIDVLPKAPAGGAGYSAPEIKYFYKRAKTFKADCRVMLQSSGGGAWTYNNTAKTLTRNNINPFPIDSVTLGLNDSVLVNINGELYNGIFQVTQLGTSDPGGVPMVLTRTETCGGIYSATYMSLGYDVFDGTSVNVTEGAVYGGTSWVLNWVRKGGPLLDGTELVNWTQIVASDKNCDQLCVMWFDGSYTAMASGPEYDLS
jgi:hypothetical protein